MRLVFSFFLFWAISFSASSQSILGKWKTIDDESGEMKSIVELYMKDGELFGKVVELFRKPDEVQNPHCDDCEDDRKGKPILGMEIIRGLEKSGDEWDDGTICDPANGKIYDCKLWVDEDNPDRLNVRGYVMFFFRTQQWIRHSD